MANMTFSHSFPIQAAPVQRRPEWGAVNGGPGVEAAAWYDDLWNTVSPAIPGLVGSLLTSI
jgi:hypothetical protein